MDSKYHPTPPLPNSEMKEKLRDAETKVFTGAELATLCKNNLNQNR